MDHAGRGDSRQHGPYVARPRSYLVPAPQWVLALALLLATSATVWIVTSFAASRAVSFVLLEVLAILVATHLLFERGLILSTSRGVAGDIGELDRFAGVSLCHRGNARQSVPSRGVAVCGQAAGVVARRVPEAIGLSGKRMEVTILFTDIRGFTAFTEQVSEEQGPEVVVQLLNEYMALMVGIIVMYHGHVNKFIGDGILAVFSDDDEGVEPGDHALRAVRCATRMVTARSRFETGAGHPYRPGRSGKRRFSR